MNISEVMTRDVQVLHPQATLRMAAEQMRALDVGAIPVCDGERLVGMLTDRDIVVRAIALGRDPSATDVSACMSPEICWCYEDDPVERAAEAMEKYQVRRLPILDRNKRLVGIVSLGDLATEEGISDRLSGEVLEEVSEPGNPLAH